MLPALGPFVLAGAEHLHKLHGETADRRQQQGVDKAAFMQQELLDDPNQQKEGTDIPEHWVDYLGGAARL